jgi:hypothetical protein
MGYHFPTGEDSLIQFKMRKNETSHHKKRTLNAAIDDFFVDAQCWRCQSRVLP